MLLIDRAVNSLLALVFGLEGTLHVEVELTLGLDALLLHVSHDALMHGLAHVKREISVMGGVDKGREEGAVRFALPFAGSEQRLLCLERRGTLRLGLSLRPETF